MSSNNSSNNSINSSTNNNKKEILALCTAGLQSQMLNNISCINCNCKLWFGHDVGYLLHAKDTNDQKNVTNALEYYCHKCSQCTMCDNVKTPQETYDRSLYCGSCSHSWNRCCKCNVSFNSSASNGQVKLQPQIRPFRLKNPLRRNDWNIPFLSICPSCVRCTNVIGGGAKRCNQPIFFNRLYREGGLGQFLQGQAMCQTCRYTFKKPIMFKAKIQNGPSCNLLNLAFGHEHVVIGVKIGENLGFCSGPTCCFDFANQEFIQPLLANFCLQLYLADKNVGELVRPNAIYPLQPPKLDPSKITEVLQCSKCLFSRLVLCACCMNNYLTRSNYVSKQFVCDECSNLFPMYTCNNNHNLLQ